MADVTVGTLGQMLEALPVGNGSLEASQVALGEFESRNSSSVVVGTAQDDEGWSNQQPSNLRTASASSCITPKP